MFTNLSWANYLVVVTLLLAIYYTVIGIRFYSIELQHLWFRFRKPTLNFASDKDISESEFLDMEVAQDSTDNTPEQPIINPIQEIEQLSGQFHEALTRANSELFSKEAFIQLLRPILKFHPFLNDEPIKSSMQDLIISECEKNGTIELSKEEINELWNEMYR
jgi:hypothetical protein